MKHKLRPILLNSVKVGSATSLMVLLILVAIGCQSRRDDLGSINTAITPPTNAHTLNSGKITQFVPLPGLPNDPSDKILLAAFNLSHLSGSTARSGAVTFQSGNGNNLVSCLVVNGNVLVILEDFIRQAFGTLQSDEALGSTVLVHGAPYNNKPFIERRQGEIFLCKDSPHYVRLTPGSSTALVGGEVVQLDHPMLWQDGKHPLRGDHVLLLSDLLRLWHEHDKQMGSGVSIRNVKIIYDLRDYQR